MPNVNLGENYTGLNIKGSVSDAENNTITYSNAVIKVKNAQNQWVDSGKSVSVSNAGLLNLNLLGSSLDTTKEYRLEVDVSDGYNRPVTLSDTFSIGERLPDVAVKVNSTASYDFGDDIPPFIVNGRVTNVVISGGYSSCLLYTSPSPRDS